MKNKTFLLRGDVINVSNILYFSSGTNFFFFLLTKLVEYGYVSLSCWSQMTKANNKRFELQLKSRRLCCTSSWNEEFLHFTLKQKEPELPRWVPNSLSFVHWQMHLLHQWRWPQTEFFQESGAACCAAIRLLFCGQNVGASGDELLWRLPASALCCENETRKSCLD